jgi:hypothetical protein
VDILSTVDGMRVRILEPPPGIYRRPSNGNSRSLRGHNDFVPVTSWIGSFVADACGPPILAEPVDGLVPLLLPEWSFGNE